MILNGIKFLVLKNKDWVLMEKEMMVFSLWNSNNLLNILMVFKSVMLKKIINILVLNVHRTNQKENGLELIFHKEVNTIYLFPKLVLGKYNL